MTTQVRIYRVTITQSYMADEQGTNFSLQPWSGDTDRYSGYDDGGTLYELPAGYDIAPEQVAPGVDGRLQIWDAKGRPVTIADNRHGEPLLMPIDGQWVTLQRAEVAAE